MNRFIFFLLFLSPISSFAQKDELRAYLRSNRITPAEIFELSSQGTLGLQKKLGVKTINQSYLENSVKDGWFSTRPLFKVAPLPAYLFLYVARIRDGWENTATYLETLRKFHQRMSHWGYPSFPIADVTDLADERLLELREQKKIGAYYYGFRFDHNGRNQRFLMELPASVETQINDLFQKEIPTSEVPVQDHELTAIVRDKITPEELVELKKIRAASKIFSENTPYVSMPGGWDNNKFEPDDYRASGKKCPLIAYCGEQSATMQSFLWSLQEKGYLHHFEVRSKVQKNYFINNHAGVLLQNKRSKIVYVLDSWLVPGGKEAKILPIREWALWRYNTHEIGSLVCNELLTRT